MRRITTGIATFGVVALAASAVQAQTKLSAEQGEAVRLPVKGTLKSLSGNVPLTFRVYDRATGGRLIYQETQTVRVHRSIYVAMVGQRPGGLSALARTPLLWVEVARGGSALGPRQSFAIVSSRDEVGTLAITHNAAQLCFTCGGTWPHFSGSWSIEQTNGVTERAGACSGSLVITTDDRPFLCTK